MDLELDVEFLVQEEQREERILIKTIVGRKKLEEDLDLE